MKSPSILEGRESTKTPCILGSAQMVERRRIPIESGRPSPWRPHRPGPERHWASRRTTESESATGEKTLLVNDIYDVLDWSAVEERLTAEPDVVGDHEHGWSRLERPSEEWSSTLWAVNPRGHERLEVFCRSQTRADAARPGTENVLGDSVRYLTREIIDPTSPAAIIRLLKTQVISCLDRLEKREQLLPIEDLTE